MSFLETIGTWCEQLWTSVKHDNQIPSEAISIWWQDVKRLPPSLCAQHLPRGQVTRGQEVTKSGGQESGGEEVRRWGGHEASRSRGHEVMRSRGQEVMQEVRRSQGHEDDEARRWGGQEGRRSRGQEVTRSEGLKVTRSGGPEVRR